jgi:ABC-type antimicrobial peptide transport system permease subunit
MLRSALTILGIIVGVAALITMLAVGVRPTHAWSSRPSISARI